MVRDAGQFTGSSGSDSTDEEDEETDGQTSSTSGTPAMPARGGDPRDPSSGAKFTDDGGNDSGETDNQTDYSSDPSPIDIPEELEDGNDTGSSSDGESPTQSPGGQSPAPGDSTGRTRDQQRGQDVVVTDSPGDTQNAISRDQLQQIDDQLAISVNEDDLRYSDGQLVLSRDARQRAAEEMQEFRAGVASATSQLDDSQVTLTARDFFPEEYETVEQQVEEANPGMEAGEDFDVVLSESGEYEANFDRTAGSSSETGEQTRSASRDLARGNLGDPEEIAAEDASQQLGFEVTERDISSVQASGRGLQYELAPAVATAAAFEQQAQQGPGSVDVQRTQDGGFDVQVSGTANASLVERDLDRDLQQRVEASQPQQRTAQGERFDFDWSFGFGGPEDEVEQFLDQGVDASRQVTGAAGEFGSSLAGDAGGGFARGAADIVTTPLRLPGTALEAAEAGAYGLRGPDQTRQVINEGATRVGQATSYYIQNPVEGGTVLAGSLAASYGATTAASRYAGPTTAAATRYAIQPVEELAYATGGRALGVGRGTADAPASTTGGGSRLDRVRQLVDDTDASTPGPRISIERDAEAPVLDIDAELEQAVRDRVGGIRETPQRVAGGIQSRFQAGADSLADADLRTLAPDVRAGASQAATRTREAGSEAVQVAQAGLDTTRQQVTQAELRAEELGYRAGERTRAELDRVLSLDAESLGSGLDSGLDRADSLVGGLALQRDTSAGDLGLQQAFLRGSQFPTGDNPLRGLGSGRLADLRAALDDRGRRAATRSPSVTGDAALQQAFLRGSDLPAPSRDDLGGFVQALQVRADQARDSLDRGGRRAALASPSVGGDAGLQQAFLRGSSLPYPTDRPRFDGEFSLEGARARAREEATALRFAASERAASARRRASGLGDLTIRVGDPERATLFDIDEPGALRSQSENPLNLDGDTTVRGDGDAESRSRTTSDSDTDRTATVDEQDTASGNQLLRTRSDSEAEQPSPEPLMETSPRRQGRVEGPSAAQPDAAGQGQQLLEQAQQRLIPVQPQAATGRASSALQVGTRGSLASLVGLEAGALSGTNTVADTDTGFRLQAAQSNAQEQRQEQRQETAQEPARWGGGGRGRFMQPDDSDTADPGRPVAMLDSGGSEADSSPASGWFNEYVVTLAGGDLDDRSTPENLDQYRRGNLGIGLPTEGQADPGDELAGNLDEVQQFFFLGDGDTEDNSGGLL